jgi:DNA topoisomerase II
MASAKTTNDAIASKYRSHTQESHILALPDTYIGSVEEDIQEVLVLNESKSAIIQESLKIVPGLYKVFDEVLVNALDQFTRLYHSSPPVDYPVKKIAVEVNLTTGEISILNDGVGIEVVEHPVHKCYVAEMIFGKLLTSSNYDKDEKKIVGGKNGYGSKLANIFSKKFIVESVDHTREKKYIQQWTDNMSIVSTPKITSSKVKPYTKITWIPDYERFGLTGGLTPAMMSLFHRRTLDCALWCGTGVKVSWNGEPVECKNILQYSKLLAEPHPVVSLKPSDMWEVVVATSPEGFRQVSFVNGIHTSKGGTHVRHVVKQITDSMCEAIEKKFKKTIKPAIVQNSMLVIVKCSVVNPSFTNQVKDELTTPVSKMGTSWKLDPKDTSILMTKTGIVETIMSRFEEAEAKTMKKTDGKKLTRITGIPKLEDATLAGTKQSVECTLILTEGDSAATTAISGLKVIGRERFGVFPLRGKMINAKNNSDVSVHENAEIQSIKKILGLVAGKKYSSLTELRYGKVMIMTDQDHDGSHIKGLVLNMFHAQWPELLKLGMVISMLTPIVKVFKGGSGELSFYTLYDYEQWKERQERTTQGLRGYRIKYYKGLGTSTAQEAREYFVSLRSLSYLWDGDASDRALKMAFEKGYEDHRKRWIEAYDPADILKYSDVGAGKTLAIPIQDFVNKDLIAYSYASNIRAIPSLMDGLKVSQRKILFGCFKRNLTGEVKVAQLAGYIAEHSSYHHGEQSLNQTITAMAQNFVGSNNINLLKPCGQFGSRLLGGDDASSPRYIQTQLMPIVFSLFKKDDQPILKYLDDDGMMVEPEYYAPVIPMILVNGSRGLGTGFSTLIPSYNPMKILTALRARIESLPAISGAGTEEEEDEDEDMDVSPFSESQSALLPGIGEPWYLGFKGKIHSVEGKSGKFEVEGTYTIVNETQVVIDELPVGTWTKNYREFLETLLSGSPLCKKPILSEIVDQYNDMDVKFTLTFEGTKLMDLIEKGSDEFLTTMKLTSSINTTNMWLYNSKGMLQKFTTPEEILEAFIPRRLQLYGIRKDYQLKEMRKQETELSAKVRFIEAILNGEINLQARLPDDVIRKTLETLEIPGISHDTENEKHSSSSSKGEEDVLAPWKYLFRMPIRSLTEAKRQELLKELETLRLRISVLEATSPQTLWKQDLDELEESYTEFLKEYEELLREASLGETPKPSGNERRRVIKKKMKSS